MDLVLLLVTFITPILLVTFVRSKWLAVSLGTVSFFSGVVLDTMIECWKPQALCTTETYKAKSLLIGLVAGLIYTLLALLVSRLVALLRE